jgi:hypothetical protein
MVAAYALTNQRAIIVGLSRPSCISASVEVSEVITRHKADLNPFTGRVFGIPVLGVAFGKDRTV